MSPFIDVSALTAPMLSFYLISNNETHTNVDFSVDVWDGTAWVLDVFTSNTNTVAGGWEKIDVFFTGLTITGNIQIRFVVDETNGTDFYDDVAIDDVVIQETPLCANPSTLVASNVTLTGADIAWVENGSATLWNIEYGVSGFTPGTGTVETGVTNPYTLTGLNNSTTYDIYVQADCGSGSLSAWSSASSFTTPCGVAVAPWTTDFENGGVIPNCWTQGASNGEPWKFSNTGSGNHVGNNGVLTGSTISGGYFAWVDDSSPNSIGTSLLSPMIDVSALTVPMLSFYLISHNEGNTNVDFSVDVWDGAAWNIGLFTSNSNTLNGGWEEIEVFFNTLTITGNIQLRFVVDETNGTDFYDDVAIDDVRVREAPTCLKPTNLVVTNITQTTADLDWTENNGSSTWNIEYGVVGFTQGTGTPANNITAKPHNITISPLSDYEFYVQTDCGGDLSDWSGPFFFSNDYCGVSTTYSEYLSSITSTGAESNVLYTAFSQPAGSYANETAQVFESYETQTFDMTTVYSSGSNGVNIWIDWNNDYTFDPVTELVASTSGSSATHTQSIMVPSGTALGDYRVRVRGQWGSTSNPPPCGNVNYGSTVDFTLSIIAPPSCLTPSALTASNITSSQAELGWTENGTATAWNVEYGAPGFVQGSGTTVAATSNPYVLTINSNSEYDYYVQADCGGGDLSAWAGPFNFSNTYCDFTSNNTTKYIQSFETSTGITNISNLLTGPGSTTAAAYSDFTAMSVSGYELLDIDFTITADATGSTYGYAIYIDWNNDFVFDASERVYGSNSYSASPTSNSFTVPLGVAVGNYRMRVIADWLTGNIQQACTGSYAEAEDYTFMVITPPTCLPPSNLATSNPTTTSLELAWQENNTATSWNIEYGVSGFTPGTGTVITVTTNPYTLTGLNPSTTYDFYVQSDCGGGDISAWSASTTAPTNCGIAVAPFYEGFNNAILPYCWENTSSNPSTSANNFWKFSGAPGYGATANGRPVGTYAWTDGSTPNPDSIMLVSPEIDISQLTTPYLSFEWFSNNTQNPLDNNPMIIEVFDGTSWNFIDTLIADSVDWMFVNYDLSAFSNNIIQVRFMINQNTTTNAAFYSDILLDDFRIDDCISLGGQDGMLDICRLDSTVNLENNLIVKPNGGGIWSFPGQPAYVVDDTVFNVQFLPAGSYEVYYVERYVCYDTTTATINVFGPSSAGLDGTTTVCKNEPINLYGVLGGNVDLGGDWYDFSNTLLPNSQPKAQAIPGQYNYTYIVSNGVCPADTSIVEVGVLDSCDFLAIGIEEFTDISVYPNPTTNILNIVNPSNTSSLKVEMLDMNGRVVLIEDKALTNASEASITIEHLERGIYTLRVYNNTGQKTFKIVKQ